MMDKTGQNPRELPENGFAIYQLKPDPQYHSLRFASLSELHSLGQRDGNFANAAHSVTESRYDLVYSSALSPALAANRTPEAILEGLYTRFNLNRPDDFRGHSLSVSDVIALNLNGKMECYYTAMMREATSHVLITPLRRFPSGWQLQQSTLRPSGSRLMQPEPKLGDPSCRKRSCEPKAHGWLSWTLH
mgnify:FL=1